MRILLTTDTIGGVWTFTKELTAGLLSMGHAVALVSFGRAPSREQADWCTSMGASYGDDFQYAASPAPLEWMDSNENAYIAGELLLRRMTTEFCPDLLHANQYCFGRLPVPIPRLITAHSDVLSWAAACRPKGLEPSSWLTQYRTMVEQGIAAADAIVAPTQWMLDALGQHFFLAAQKRVILNGRGCPHFIPSEHRSMQAVSAGRLWDEAKNLAILADVHTAIPILVAGEREYEGASAAGKIGTAVQLGLLGEDDLHALFGASSIYLATSIYEPFGLAPLEAALCGCAILANDIASLREVWGDAALYFNHAAELTDLLARLQAFPEILFTAQRRARRRALELSATRMTTEYLALYSELVSTKERVYPALAEASAIYAS